MIFIIFTKSICFVCSLKYCSIAGERATEQMSVPRGFGLGRKQPIDRRKSRYLLIAFYNHLSSAFQVSEFGRDYVRRELSRGMTEHGSTILAGWLFIRNAIYGKAAILYYLKENRGLTVACDFYNYPAKTVVRKEGSCARERVCESCVRGGETGIGGS